MQRRPSAVSVVVQRPKVSRSDGLVDLRVESVCFEVLPSSEVELRDAVRSVLRALEALHTRRLVHRDVRWPNVLRSALGEWLLADFELADSIGEALPEQFRDGACVPPEARLGGPWGPACDLWQLGRLVSVWGHGGDRAMPSPSPLRF